VAPHPRWSGQCTRGRFARIPKNHATFRSPSNS
jgi:hypothetical protein